MSNKYPRYEEVTVNFMIPGSITFDLPIEDEEYDTEDSILFEADEYVAGLDVEEMINNGMNVVFDFVEVESSELTRKSKSNGIYKHE